MYSYRMHGPFIWLRLAYIQQAFHQSVSIPPLALIRLMISASKILYCLDCTTLHFYIRGLAYSNRKKQPCIIVSF